MRRFAAVCSAFILCVCAFAALEAGAHRSTSPSQPVVTLDPSPDAVCAGDQTDFQSAATQSDGSSLPAGGLQWQVFPVGGSTYTDLPGATGNPLHLTTSAADDGNLYRAAWTNSTTHEGPAFSQPAHLTVQTETLLTASPSGETVAPGSTASFTASATVNGSTPTPTVQWQVDLPGTSTVWNDIPGATSPTLSLTASGTDDGNQYRAVFSDVCGPAINTDSAMLTVQSLPAVTTNPANAGPVNVGDAVSFTAAASGYPAPSVQWQYSYDGTNWIDFGGQTSTTLAFTASSLDNGKRYRAEFTNRVGTTASAVATLAVDFAPIIVDDPINDTPCPGSSAGFFSDARANPAATEQWQSSPDGITWTNIPGATSSSLSFTPTAGDDGVQYRAVFTNSVGTTDSDPGTLTVATTPAVTLNPVNTTVAPGAQASFTVAATGHPTPLVSWQSSTDGGATWSPILGLVPSTTITFSPSASADGNEYRAVFRLGECGQVFTTAATLHVVAPVPAPAPPGPTVTTLMTAGPSGTLATDGSLAGDVGVLGGTDSVAWPAGAFGPATVTLSQTAGVGNVAGFAAGGAVLSLSVTGTGGNAITAFPVPLVLHMTPSGPPPFVPSYSPDGLTWVPIPQLAAPTLPPGQPDGYFLNPGGSIDIYTRHATFFGVLKDVQAPSAPTSLRASYAPGRLTFTWGASTDNVGVSGYTLLGGATPESIQGGATTIAVRPATGVYSLHATDAAGNKSADATVTVAARPRPKAIPRMIPRWAFQLLAGGHPSAPRPLPTWYAAWKKWRLNPYTFTA